MRQSFLRRRMPLREGPCVFFDDYKITAGTNRKTAFFNEVGIDQDRITIVKNARHPQTVGRKDHGAIIPKGEHVSPFECNNEFYIFPDHNGTDVMAWEGQICRKDV